MSTTTADPSAVVEVTEVSEPKEPKVGPALKKATRATGHGLHVAGRAVIDTDLRDMGKGIKRLLSKSPIKVRVERPATDDS